MSSILILYQTTDGHTRDICDRLQDLIESQGHAVSVVPVEAADGVAIGDFDKVVLGASIRYGKHAKSVYAFIERHAQALDARPNAFFSVNAVARKPNRNTAETNPYVKRFLTQIPWRPQRVVVFAGKINYPIYGFWDRQIIRLIMTITKGPTDPNAVVEFTDWDQVEAFADEIANL
ncbi:MAG: menaquinone-dependent protoporphyrinogen IX dehydrogenase [Gammaproteobacteria bacterium]|nr:menaquinone-dependent protoporphyrinogen IX dehydrogenase [Gammaproteobacteria bacterium]